MANLIEAFSGLFLIGFTFIIFMYALPGLTDITTTGPGTTWENSSSFTVQAVGVANQVLVILPFLLFFIGLALFFQGVGG